MRVQVRGERTVTPLPLILGYSAGGQGGSHQKTTTTIIAVVCKTSLVRACGHIRKQKNSSHGRVVVVSTRGGRVWKEEAAVCQPPDHHRWSAPRQPTSYRKEIVIIFPSAKPDAMVSNYVCHVVDAQIHCEHAGRTTRQDDMRCVAHSMISQESSDHSISDQLSFEMNL